VSPFTIWPSRQRISSEFDFLACTFNIKPPVSRWFPRCVGSALWS